MKNEIDTVARVRQLAGERGMSVSRLAAVCGVNPSTISVTAARGGQLQVDTIVRICDALELTLSEFFTPPEPGAAAQKQGPARHAV